jgi:hypothetical protein
MALEKDHASLDFANNNDLDSKEPAGLGSDPNLDTERATRSRFGTSNRAAGARIAPVLPHLRGYDFGSDDSGSDILGKQIELEAGNAIQYRTCSWPKASLNPSDHERHSGVSNAPLAID